MDNASVHASRKERLRELISAAGALLIFLPPYSPDLSPIEPGFGLVKKGMQRQQRAAAAAPIRPV